MDSETQQEQTLGEVLRRVVPLVALVWVLLPLTFFVPWLDSTSPPYFDLSGWIGTVAQRLALSAGGDWGPRVVLFLILVLVSRPGLSIKRRGIELVVVGLAVLVLQGGGSAFNEVVIKRTFKEPRPHVKQLARTPPGGPSEQSILKISPDSLYRLDRGARRAYIQEISGYNELITPGSSRQVCFEEYGEELHLNHRVCRHWASTTGGFSFPSGHALSAMFMAAFFLGMALHLLSGWRLWFFQCVVVPWTVLVAYCRVVLRVHSPLDISVGGLLGIGFGLAALALAVSVLNRIGREPAPPG